MELIKLIKTRSDNLIINKNKWLKYLKNRVVHVDTIQQYP